MSNRNRPIHRSPSPMLSYQHRCHCTLTPLTSDDLLATDSTTECFECCNADGCEDYHEDDTTWEQNFSPLFQSSHQGRSAPSASVTSALIAGDRTPRRYGTVVHFADPLVTRIYSEGLHRYPRMNSDDKGKGRELDFKLDLEKGTFSSAAAVSPRRRIPCQEQGGFLGFQRTLAHVIPLCILTLYVWVWLTLEDEGHAVVLQWSFIGTVFVATWMYAFCELRYSNEFKCECESSECDGTFSPGIRLPYDNFLGFIGMILVWTPIVWIFALFVRSLDSTSAAYWGYGAVILFVVCAWYPRWISRHPEETFQHENFV